MRFSVCKAGDIKTRVDMEVYREEMFKRELEKAMEEGHICGVALKKAKRFRSAFTTEQINYLEKEFKKHPYVGNARRKDVAITLNIPERAVKIWFQNRRMKEKKDTSNKEPDSGKSIVINDALKMRKMPSANDNEESLPLLTSQVSPINMLTEPNYESGSISSSSISGMANCKPQCVIEPKLFSNPSVIINSTTSAPDFTPQPKIEKKDEDTKIRAAESTVQDQIRQDSPVDYVSYKAEVQNLSYSHYPTSSSVPEDLSSKTKQTNSSSQRVSELPFYLKGYYAQPYLPPSNLIWRPVDVAPIVPAPVSMVQGPGSSQPMMKGNCCCDCHKPYPTPMLLQNSSGPNVQYVVTAVPFANSSPKY